MEPHGGKVVSLMCQPPFTLQEDSWYSFLLEAELAPGQLEELLKLKKYTSLGLDQMTFQLVA
jgi:hypothetical protein